VRSALHYSAYADALDAADRREETREWFAKCAELDRDEVTDAEKRAHTS